MLRLAPPPLVPQILDPPLLPSLHPRSAVKTFLEFVSTGEGWGVECKVKVGRVMGGLYSAGDRLIPEARGKTCGPTEKTERKNRASGSW